MDMAREIGNVAAWRQNGCCLLISVVSRENRIDMNHRSLFISGEEEPPVSDPEAIVPF
jgi:hypothetical protein